MKVSETRDHFIDLYAPRQYAVRRKDDNRLVLVETSLTAAVLEAQVLERPEPAAPAEQGGEHVQ